MTDEKLRSVFSVFDTESKGAVSADNMRFAFEKLGIHMEVEEA
jgi:Ca2+-binding EF-hand superfamily protein